MGAASAPASAATSVAASPQRSLFADMLPPLAPATVAAPGAAAPESGAASGVASPTQQSMLGAGGLPPYSGFGGLGGLLHQQQPAAAQAGSAQQQQLPAYLPQSGAAGQPSMLGSLTPSALEAALLSKSRQGGGAAPASGGGQEDTLGLGLLPFAVAEAALFDDSPAAAHTLPLAVADFVLGGDDFGSGGGSGGAARGLRDSQGSDFSDVLGQMLPGGSPLKPPAPKGGAAASAAGVLNGMALHARQASAGGESGGSLFGGPMDRQQISLAAAAAWGPHSSHSSLDSAAGLAAAGKEGGPAGSSASSTSDVLLRFDQQSTATSGWLRTAGRAP
jgi:hypothetical protein